MAKELTNTDVKQEVARALLRSSGWKLVKEEILGPMRAQAVTNLSDKCRTLEEFLSAQATLRVINRIESEIVGYEHGWSKQPKQ